MLKPAFSPGRFKEIIAVFVKYGFEDVLGYLKLPGMRASHKLTRVPDGLTPYERIRMAFEELGPTFVKFGQIMSLRSDLLPRPLIVELERLQDKAAPVDRQSILKVLEDNLPQTVDHVFARFDEVPIASASLSQVHRAVLRSDGRMVALKVQRPGIEADILRDLDIFAYIARRLHEHAESLQVYNLPSLVDLLRKTLAKEVNFLREARHMDIAREQMKDLPGIHIPSVWTHFSSEKVLVMENIEGTRPGHMIQEGMAQLASIGLAAAVKQILENGFFHADMHPGNMLIVDQETLCLLDWGMARLIHPQLDIIAELKPHLKRLTMSRFKPDELWHRLRAMAFKLVLSPARFPKQIAEIVEKMQRGELRLRFEHRNLYELRHTLEKTFSRLTLGINRKDENGYHCNAQETGVLCSLDPGDLLSIYGDLAIGGHRYFSEGNRSQDRPVAGVYSRSFAGGDRVRHNAFRVSQENSA